MQRTLLREEGAHDHRATGRRCGRPECGLGVLARWSRHVLMLLSFFSHMKRRRISRGGAVQWRHVRHHNGMEAELIQEVAFAVVGTSVFKKFHHGGHPPNVASPLTRTLL